MLINPQSFALIKDGAKTIELRLLNDEDLKRLKPKSELTFINRETEEQLAAAVLSVQVYPDSEAAAAHEPIDQIGPFKTPEELVERMRLFQSQEEERQLGIIAIRFVLV